MTLLLTDLLGTDKLWNTNELSVGSASLFLTTYSLYYCIALRSFSAFVELTDQN